MKSKLKLCRKLSKDKLFYIKYKHIISLIGQKTVEQDKAKNKRNKSF